jgi:hypothetical protein
MQMPHYGTSARQLRLIVQQRPRRAVFQKRWLIIKPLSPHFCRMPYLMPRSSPFTARRPYRALDPGLDSNANVAPRGQVSCAHLLPKLSMHHVPIKATLQGRRGKAYHRRTRLVVRLLPESQLDRIPL